MAAVAQCDSLADMIKCHRVWNQRSKNKTLNSNVETLEPSSKVHESQKWNTKTKKSDWIIKAGSLCALLLARGSQFLCILISTGVILGVFSYKWAINYYYFFNFKPLNLCSDQLHDHFCLAHFLQCSFFSVAGIPWVRRSSQIIELS